jgi:serine/threonine protein kinase
LQLNAVGYLHERKLVHRDIHPENFFVSIDGLLKLGNLEKLEAQDGGPSLVTQIPAYSSPEAFRQYTVRWKLLGQLIGRLFSLQFRDMMLLAHPLQHQSKGMCHPADDVWGLGVIIYLFFTGRFPWASARPDDANFVAFKRGEYYRLDGWTCFSHQLISVR